MSVHFYPERGKVDAALEALKVYQVGKPVVVEECFPLKCSADELAAFMKRAEAGGLASGWISFYWGKTAEEYRDEEGIGAALKAMWLERFAALGAAR